MKHTFKIPPLPLSSALPVAAMLLALAAGTDAHAALPTMPTVEGIDGSAVADGDWLGMMGGLFKKGVTILGLIVAAWAFIQVVVSGFDRWKKYSAGQMNLGELKEFLIVAVVFVAFVIAMVTIAFEVFA